MTLAEIHYRTMSLDLALRDEDGSEGLTASGLIVPYGVRASITEIHAGQPVTYPESFARGAFERACRQPSRLPLMLDHSDRFDDRLGYAVALAETDRGLEGTFRLDRSRADHARDVLTSSHAALSIAFLSIIPKAGTERDGQHVVRRSVHAVHVAAVPDPAYADARIIAVRAAAAPALGEPTAAEVEYEHARAAQDELREWLKVAAEQQQRYSASQ